VTEKFPRHGLVNTSLFQEIGYSVPEGVKVFPLIAGLPVQLEAALFADTPRTTL